MEEGGEDEAAFMLGAQKGDASSNQIKNGGWRLSSYQVASRGDEKLGLSQEQIARETQVASKDDANEAKDKGPSDVHFL